jgi:hypothetical protein
MPACNLERWMKNFNGRPFFSLFFIARANQKIPNLALGLESTDIHHQLVRDFSRGAQNLQNTAGEILERL